MCTTAAVCGYYCEKQPLYVSTGYEQFKLTFFCSVLCGLPYRQCERVPNVWHVHDLAFERSYHSDVVQFCYGWR